jgi:hypothetical protein
MIRALLLGMAHTIIYLVLTVAGILWLLGPVPR